MKPTIYASFASIEDAEKATGALMDFGLKAEDISLVANEQYQSRLPFYSGHPVGRDGDNTTEYTNTAVVDAGEGLSAKSGISTTTPGDAAAGATTGAEVGLGIGTVLAIAAMFVPGVGLVAGGGALAMAIAGAAATAGAGAVAGGAVGYLKDQGVPDNVVSTYNEAVSRGGAVLAIHSTADVSQSEVEEILGKYNAQNVGGYGYATTNM